MTRGLSVTDGVGGGGGGGIGIEVEDASLIEPICGPIGVLLREMPRGPPGTAGVPDGPITSRGPPGTAGDPEGPINGSCGGKGGGGNADSDALEDDEDPTPVYLLQSIGFADAALGG